MRILCGYSIRFVLLQYDLLTRKTLPSQVEQTFLDDKVNLGLLTPFEASQEISLNAPTLPMRVTLASFDVAGQISVNLKLRSRRVFPTIMAHMSLS